MKNCTRCETILEFIYTVNFADHYYCQNCNRETAYNYELVSQDEKLEELYGV
jgi:hypothetical protein